MNGLQNGSDSPPPSNTIHARARTHTGTCTRLPCSPSRSLCSQRTRMNSSDSHYPTHAQNHSLFPSRVCLGRDFGFGPSWHVSLPLLLGHDLSQKSPCPFLNRCAESLPHQIVRLAPVTAYAQDGDPTLYCRQIGLCGSDW